MTEITIELDDAREVMYDELADEFNEAAIEEDLEAAVRQRLTDLYDNRDQIVQQQQ